jgi:hypothetical protein
MKQSLGNQVYNLLREAHKYVHEAQNLVLLGQDSSERDQLESAVSTVDGVLYLAEGEAARIGNPL